MGPKVSHLLHNSLLVIRRGVSEVEAFKLDRGRVRSFRLKLVGVGLAGLAPAGLTGSVLTVELLGRGNSHSSVHHWQP